MGIQKDKKQWILLKLFTQTMMINVKIMT